MAHRSGRVIDTDTLISLVLHVSSDGQEREQGPEDNPDVNAHQSRPAAALPLKTAEKEGRSQTWVSHWLLFGRFLHFIGAPIKSETIPKPHAGPFPAPIGNRLD
jgi:hypothetical protein